MFTNLLWIKKERNKDQIADMRTAIKKVKVAAKEGNKKEITGILDTANKKIDKAVSSGLVHKNKAARDKSKLAKLVNNIK